MLLVLCAAVMSCALYLYAVRGSGGSYAEVVVGGEVVEVLSLGENRVYSPPGLPAVRIAVRDGAVGFVASDCPDKVCVHSGFLSLRGQSAVCLPNRVTVRVAAGEGETLDSITY
ncbi:MAG: NusG domain II-containing protein [Synergistaceae bacterium]|nr:NusG domain II-containing protein [Synergistaceae bacterium]